MRWLHYIGGHYTPFTFLREAQRYGVSRKVAPAQARRMHYGDEVDCLYWNDHQPAKFCRFRITGITLPQEIAADVTADLAAEGKCKKVSDGGGVVIRECGSYISGAVYEVTAELGEVVERAEKTAESKGLKVDCLITGPIVEVYDPVIPMPEGYPFYQGFAREDEAPSERTGSVVTAVLGYQQRKQKRRRDLQMALPMPASMPAYA